MFNKIWKEQIVKPSSNVSIFKPKQGFDLEEEEDDECCEDAMDLWELAITKNINEVKHLKFRQIYTKDRREELTSIIEDFKSNKNCLDFKTYLQELVAIDGWGREHRIAGYVLGEWEECENV